MDGVSDITVNFAAESATVTLEKDRVSLKDVVHTIEATGFKVPVNATAVSKATPPHPCSSGHGVQQHLGGAEQPAVKPLEAVNPKQFDQSFNSRY